MTEEDFFNAYYFYNGGVITEARYTYLGYVDASGEMMPIVHAVSEKKLNKFNSQGEKELRIDINEDQATIDRTLSIIEENFTNPQTIIHNSQFCIDYRFLSYPQVIEALNEWRQNDYISSIKIIGDNYTLDEATYSQLSEFQEIIVANSDVSRNNISIENPKYAIITGINEDISPEAACVIKENMTDEELSNIIQIMNGVLTNNKKIQLRFYNPAIAVEMIERLERLGLSPEVGISILGYPLTENSDLYERLEAISNRREIDVTYVCCHDLLSNYCEEPYLIDNKYFSELEPDGKTDLKTYIKILKFIESFQQSVDGITSNIEKVMTAYQYLNDNYYYDLYAGNTKHYGATRDVDKILDTDEIVCVGYANLLSIMCRRIGIPMLTYGAPKHKMNIARIVERDEKGEVVFDKICTFDPTNDSGYYVEDVNSPTGQRRVDVKDSYTYFGIEPERWLHTSDPSYMTLANGLAIPREDFVNNALLSCSPFEERYSGGYNASSYMFSMLRLMGYRFELDQVDMFDLVAQLHEDERIGEIPTELIYRAANNIANRKNGTDLTPEARGRIDVSFALRDHLFSHPTARILLNKTANQDVINVSTYRTNMPQHEHIDIASLDIGPIYYHDYGNVRNGAPITSEPFEQPRNNDPEVQSPVNEEPVQEQPMFIEEDFSEEYIAGTTIRRPRARGIYETDEEYVAFLERYYNYYFPEARVQSTETYGSTREQPLFTEEDYSDEYIEGTNIRKPRFRGNHETDEEYVEFLGEFYNHHFPDVEPITVRIFGDVDIFTEEDFSEGYIPHTNIRKPRERGIYETDEEYVEFLERFYNHYFPNSNENSNNGRSR